MATDDSEQSPAKIEDVKVTRSPSETEQFSDLYPERKGPRLEYSTWEVAKGRNSTDHYRTSCEINITRCLEWPLIKLMLGALKSQGCITDMFERHISCDICKDGKDFM